jgi:hypothetical protein
MAKKRVFIIPTPINVLSTANENIVSNLRRGRRSDLQLPSLYRLAFAVHYNTGEMLIEKDESDQQDQIT